MMTNATMAGLDLRVVDATGPGSAAAAGEPAPIVILLHGFSMRADDLAPFGASLGLPALFLFPEGPIDLGPVGLPGRAWWMIDVASRDDDIAQGRQRDLGREAPAGLPAANRALGALVGEVLAQNVRCFWVVFRKGRYFHWT